MRTRALLPLVFFFNGLFSQNNARLFTSEGGLFKIYLNDKTVNNTPQAEVLIEQVKKDTLALTAEFENNRKLEFTIYLLDRGEPTANKEFSYKLNLLGDNLNVEFIGMSDIQPLPDPIVPKKPEIDTSAKYKNSQLGHFAELKDGKADYYNNVPKDKSCAQEMPEEYFQYIQLLMSKAEIDGDKFTIAENTARNNCLSTLQLVKLLTYIEYEIDKLKLVAIAWPNIVDKKNQQNLEKSFRFESSLNELKSFLKNTSDQNKATIDCQTPSSGVEIDAFAERIGTLTNDTQRFEAFKKSYSGYCFSLAQSIQILQIFIHDREKLDAAKMLYFYSADKEKFSGVTEVFSYKTTAADLIEFIGKQKN